MVTEMRSCSVCVKKLVKMGLSEGGGVQLDVFLNRGGGVVMNVLAKKIFALV